jgi:hypothetical protein
MKKTIFMDKYFDFCIEQVEDIYNLDTIARKLGEMDKLKLILLNQDQYNCLSFLSKPEIIFSAFKRKNSEVFMKIIKGDEKSRVKEIANYFIELDNVKDDDVDGKFFDMLDQNVVTLLEKFVEARKKNN